MTCRPLTWRHVVKMSAMSAQHVVRLCRPDHADDVTCRVGATSADMSADSFGHKEDVASSKTCRHVADMSATCQHVGMYLLDIKKISCSHDMSWHVIYCGEATIFDRKYKAMTRK
jgi:hypothetical protein